MSLEVWLKYLGTLASLAWLAVLFLICRGQR